VAGNCKETVQSTAKVNKHKNIRPGDYEAHWCEPRQHQERRNADCVESEGKYVGRL